MKRRYVVSKRKPIAPPLPKGRVIGSRFIEANGLEFEIRWDGKGPLPGSQDWPQGSTSTLAIHTIGHPVVTP